MIEPLICAMELTGTKWRLPILLILTTGSLRYNELKKALIPIADTTLSRELKALERHKLIERLVVETFPPSSVYAATHLGLSLKTIAEAMSEWGADLGSVLLKNKRKTEDISLENNNGVSKATTSLL